MSLSMCDAFAAALVSPGKVFIRCMEPRSTWMVMSDGGTFGTIRSEPRLHMVHGFDKAGNLILMEDGWTIYMSQFKGPWIAVDRDEFIKMKQE